ncbi:ABC transporter permease [Undibacterium oligocarboniphilum]|uniref:ABC transporter permease n=1 Tax=Undibacterium oligocarboniphilum TaxID=666702 RepID=A0A850Q844_9BURK|nr:ABC transporter permease [Undibacterium oligocarboniphilum]NVO76402.1 ABC transporter permease [Undibacterium oligocarboniphilum]
MNSTTHQHTPPIAISDEERKAMSAAQRHHYLVIFLRIALAVVMLVAWETAVEIGWIDAFFFSRPSAIYEQLRIWIVEGTAQGPLWSELLVTMEETVLGFLIGSVLGIICGIALGRNKLASDVFSIYIKIANAIPRVVLGSIFIIMFGLGMGSKIALAVVMVFFVVFGNAFQGVREADKNLIANAYILGASKRQVTFSVVFPSALSWILASLHVSFGFALVGAVVGEFLGARHGIGLLIATAQGTFNAAGVFAAMIVLAVVALAAEYLLTAAENRLLKWRPAQFVEKGM